MKKKYESIEDLGIEEINTFLRDNEYPVKLIDKSNGIEELEKYVNMYYPDNENVFGLLRDGIYANYEDKKDFFIRNGYGNIETITTYELVGLIQENDVYEIETWAYSQKKQPELLENYLDFIDVDDDNYNRISEAIEYADIQEQGDLYTELTEKNSVNYNLEEFLLNLDNDDLIDLNSNFIEAGDDYVTDDLLDLLDFKYPDTYYYDNERIYNIGFDFSNINKNYIIFDEEVDISRGYNTIEEFLNNEIDEKDITKIKEKYLYSNQNKTIKEIQNNYYKEELEKNEFAKTYLNKRNLSTETIKKFELGYSHVNSNTVKYIEAQIDTEIAENIVNNKAGKDFFNGRITIPIKNEDNELVGFSGRSIEDNDIKYLNSKTDEEFQRGNLLYNFNNYNGNGEVVITEGFFDVITATQKGMDNVVGTLGTELTNKQIELLKRNEIKNVILALDNDKAGKVSMDKMAEKLLKENVKVAVLDIGRDYTAENTIIDKGNGYVKQDNSVKDLDELFQKNKQVNIENYIVSFYDYKIEELKPKLYNDNINTRIEGATEAQKFLTIDDKITEKEKEFYNKKMEDILGVSSIDLFNKSEERGNKMKSEIIYERGFINIVPTNEQFEKYSKGEIKLKELKPEEKIETFKTKDGREFEKAKIKVVSFTEGKIDSGKAVIFTNKEEIEKLKIYEEKKTPVKVVSVLEKTEKGEYKRGIAIEDSRSIKRIKDTLENEIQIANQKKNKQKKELETEIE